jgi:hypothetical protein
MVSGIKLHTLLCELSRLLEFEIGETGPDDGAYLPGGAKHVPIKDAGKTTRNDRWNKWLPHMGRAERAIGKQDHSWLMATGVANALCPVAPAAASAVADSAAGAGAGADAAAGAGAGAGASHSIASTPKLPMPTASGIVCSSCSCSPLQVVCWQVRWQRSVSTNSTIRPRPSSTVGRRARVCVGLHDSVDPPHLAEAYVRTIRSLNLNLGSLLGVQVRLRCRAQQRCLDILNAFPRHTTAHQRVQDR